MDLNPPPIKPGTVSEAQRFARKHNRPHGSTGFGRLLFGKANRAHAAQRPEVSRHIVDADAESVLGCESDDALVLRASRDGAL